MLSLLPCSTKSYMLSSPRSICAFAGIMMSADNFSTVQVGSTRPLYRRACSADRSCLVTSCWSRVSDQATHKSVSVVQLSKPTTGPDKHREQKLCGAAEAQATTGGGEYQATEFRCVGKPKSTMDIAFNRKVSRDPLKNLQCVTHVTPSQPNSSTMCYLQMSRLPQSSRLKTSEQR